MKDILNLKECEKETLKEMTQSFIELGYLPLVYGKKELSEKETENYIKLTQIYKSSLTMEDFEAEKIFSTFEENISFITLLCLESKQDKDANEIVESLKAAKIKLSFLSGADLTNTLVGAYKTRVLSSEQEFFHLKGENFETVLFGLKTLLNKLKKTIQKYVEIEEIGSSNIKENSLNSDIFLNYFLLVGQQTFSIILGDKYLYNHFLFVLHLSNGVIGYDFTERGKGKMIKMVKDNFVEEPNILTIGSALWDVGMYKKSSIAIESIGGNNICSYQGDIIIKNKKILNDLLFKEAFIYKERFMFIVSNMMHLTFLLAWPLMISLFLNEFSCIVFLRQELISKLIFLIGLINILLICFSCEKKKEYEYYKSIPIISYFQKKNEKKMFLQLIINKSLSSLIDSLYLFFIWSLYHEFNEQSISFHSNFLPKILQFTSFINFYINVSFIYFF